MPCWIYSHIPLAPCVPENAKLTGESGPDIAEAVFFPVWQAIPFIEEKSRSFPGRAAQELFSSIIAHYGANSARIFRSPN
jgi:hypothetical protein